MATIEKYAKWCLMLIEGNDYIVDEIYEALYEDGFIDENQKWNNNEDEYEDEESMGNRY
jgi:hypothetical protein